MGIGGWHFLEQQPEQDELDPTCGNDVSPWKIAARKAWNKVTRAFAELPVREVGSPTFCKHQLKLEFVGEIRLHIGFSRTGGINNFEVTCADSALDDQMRAALHGANGPFTPADREHWLSSQSFFVTRFQQADLPSIMILHSLHRSQVRGGQSPYKAADHRWDAPLREGEALLEFQHHRRALSEVSREIGPPETLALLRERTRHCGVKKWFPRA
jgi:hypothetical protein